MLLLLSSLAAASTLSDQVSQERVVADLMALTGEAPVVGAPIVSRSIHHPDIDRAADWLHQTLLDIPAGQVTEETFQAEGEQGLRNLIWELPGAQPQLPPVVLAAHYDSTASLDEGWDAAFDPAPGADDNASGVAVVIEAARVLSSWEPGFERTIRVVLFSAEEVGLVGSRVHVDGLVERGETVRMVLVLDPVGNNPGGADFLFFAYDARWENEADALVQSALDLESPLEVGGVDADLIGGDDRSDHAPFWWADMPALHAGSFPQPPTYHTVEDVFEVVDPWFVAEVSRLSVAHAAALADPLPADAPGCGCASTPGSGDAPPFEYAFGCALLLLCRRREGSTSVRGLRMR